MLPRQANSALAAHLEALRRLHLRDLEAGFGRAPLPDALAAKYPNADRECPVPTTGRPTTEHTFCSLLETLYRRARSSQRPSARRERLANSVGRGRTSIYWRMEESVLMALKRLSGRKPHLPARGETVEAAFVRQRPNSAMKLSAASGVRSSLLPRR